MFSWGELFSTFMARKIMGVEGTCRSGNRGGYPFLYALHIAKGAPSLLLRTPPQGQKGIKSGQKGQKLDFICSLLCFLGKIGDNKGQKPNIFLKSRREDRCGE